MKPICAMIRARLFIMIYLVLAGFGSSFVTFHVARAEQKTPLVVLAAKKLGIQACLPALTQAAEENTKGATDQDIVLDWNRKSPNSSPFFTMTALGSGSEHAVLSITAIPLPRRGCALMVQRVFSSPESCSVIAQRDLSAYVGGRLIEGVLVYNNPRQPAETYTLMQNSNNCTVIFRNDTPRWSPPR